MTETQIRANKNPTHKLIIKYSEKGKKKLATRYEIDRKRTIVLIFFMKLGEIYALGSLGNQNNYKSQ